MYSDNPDIDNPGNPDIDKPGNPNTDNPGNPDIPDIDNPGNSDHSGGDNLETLKSWQTWKYFKVHNL